MLSFHIYKLCVHDKPFNAALECILVYVIHLQTGNMLILEKVDLL